MSETQKLEEESTPLEVRCPTCGALPAVPCTVPVRTETGTLRRQVAWFHESRVERTPPGSL